MSEERKTACVYTGSSIDAGMVRALLERHGISSHPAEELTGTLFPHFSGGGASAGSVQLFVRQEDEEAARLVLADSLQARPVAASDTPDHCLSCGKPMAEEDKRCPNCGWSYDEDVDAG